MNKCKKITACLLTIVLAFSIFSITAFAATENSVSYVGQPTADKDYSTDIMSAPQLWIKATNDIEAGAIFLLSVSSGSSWTIDDVSDISRFFTKNGNVYTSNSTLTNEAGFTYALDSISGENIQITTNAKLSEGNYMAIPLIVRLDGNSEASVTLSGGEVYGITGGTYVMANKGGVNEIKVDLKGTSKTDGKTILGDVEIDMSAGVGVVAFEITLPAGFVFNENNRTKVELVANGSYLDSKLAEVSFNTSKSLMKLRLENAVKSTTPGKITFKNIEVNALSNAEGGDVFMFISANAFELRNERFKFGEYTVDPADIPEPVSPSDGPKGDKIADEVQSVSVTTGSTTFVVDGETGELDVAPYNDEAGRMMVPLRFIAQAFGIGDDAIAWDPDTKEVTITYLTPEEKIDVEFTIGSNLYYVNGATGVMDTVAVIKDGYTFVPVRYVAEGFGLKVDYDNETKTAEFTRKSNF